MSLRIVLTLKSCFLACIVLAGCGKDAKPKKKKRSAEFLERYSGLKYSKNQHSLDSATLEQVPSPISKSKLHSQEKQIKMPIKKRVQFEPLSSSLDYQIEKSDRNYFNNANLMNLEFSLRGVKEPARFKLTGMLARQHSEFFPLPGSVMGWAKKTKVIIRNNQKQFIKPSKLYSDQSLSFLDRNRLRRFLIQRRSILHEFLLMFSEENEISADRLRNSSLNGPRLQLIYQEYNRVHSWLSELTSVRGK